MAKEKMTVTIDAEVLAAVDEDASAAGISRSQQVEEILRRDHWTRFWQKQSAITRALGLTENDIAAHDEMVRDSLYGTA